MTSLLVVNYRSAAHTAEAIRTARAATAGSLHVVIVDNSCDAEEAARLEGLADVVLIAPRNLGYAGGVNLGRGSCERGAIVVSNPDVRFDAGSIDHLVEALEGGAAVAGPAFFWDEGRQWHLPPGDLGTAREKLDAILASRSASWFHQRDRRRFLQRVAFWSQERTTRVKMLSGAVLAIRSHDLDELGGFDERFALYFEEADFLRRVAQHHRRIVYVPAARCHHLYNQSAGQVAESAAERFAQSEMRYLEKWNGPWAARVLKRLEKPMPPFEAPEAPSRSAAPGERDFVIEASPLASFATAAGRFSHDPGDLTVPPDVLASINGVPLYLRSVVRKTGEVLATVRISA